MLRAARSFQRTRRSRRPMQLRSFLPERRLLAPPATVRSVSRLGRCTRATARRKSGIARRSDNSSPHPPLGSACGRFCPGSARLDRSWSARQEEERSVPKHAVIGPQIVEAVDAKMADGAATRSQAFATVAKERGMSISSVSSHYYRATRAAREQGGGEPRRPPNAEPPALVPERGRREPPLLTLQVAMIWGRWSVRSSKTPRRWAGRSRVSA